MNNVEAKEHDPSNVISAFLGFVIVLAIASLPALLIYGGVALGLRIFPWLMLACVLLLGFNLIILTPLAIIPPTRLWAGLGFWISSFVFGLSGWFMGLILTWSLWGGFAVFVGFFLMGIGVVPIAMLATLLNGMWPHLGLLVLAVILTFGFRILGSVLVDHSDA